MMIPEYKGFETVNPEDFKTLLNKPGIRTHLMDHQLFDADSVMLWMQDKLAVEAADRCKVRAIYSNSELAGWCGIQLENEQYEIAIVLDEKFWGMGKAVFNDVMSWAKELGHEDVFIHFLHTRPDYKFLRRMAKHVFETEMSGDKFTTYQLPVR